MFSRIRQLIHKLSSGTLKEQLMNKLEDTKLADQDYHETNNYLKTLCYLLNIALAQVNEELDTNPSNTAYSRKSDRQEVHIDRNHTNCLPDNRKDEYNNKKISGNKRSRSHENDSENGDEEYYTNELGDKTYEKNIGHKKLKANSYATRVTDDSHNKQKQIGNNTRTGFYKQNTKRKNKDTKLEEVKEKTYF